MTYERTGDTGSIDRATHGAEPGVISGILATGGEAQDGHILEIDGGQLPEGSPMLYGHDDWSGERNLGTWDSFERLTLGSERAIRSHGRILLGGTGERKEWRQDMAYMIREKAIGALSIRWDAIGDPIPRTSLPKDHPAHIGTKDRTRKRHGLFFPEWRMMEGSVVTLGSDAEAMIGRMSESNGSTRKFWRSSINEAISDDATEGSLVAVSLGNGEFSYIERAAYEALIELANERLGLALDLYEREAVGIDFSTQTDVIQRRLSESELKEFNDLSAGNNKADLQKKQEIEVVTLPAVTPRMVALVLGERLAVAREQVSDDRRAGFDRALGRIS